MTRAIAKSKILALFVLVGASVLAGGGSTSGRRRVNQPVRRHRQRRPARDQRRADLGLHVAERVRRRCAPPGLRPCPAARS